MNRFIPGHSPTYTLTQLVCILFDALAELNDPRVTEAIGRRLGGIPLIWGNEQIWPRLAEAGSDRPPAETNQETP